MMTEEKIRNLFEEYNVPLIVKDKSGNLKRVLTLKNISYFMEIDNNILLNTICRLRKIEEEGRYLPSYMKGLAETYLKKDLDLKGLEIEKNIMYATFSKTRLNQIKKIMLVDSESIEKIATYFKQKLLSEYLLKYYYHNSKLKDDSIKSKSLQTNYLTFDYDNKSFRILNTKIDKKYSLKDVCDILNMNMRNTLSELPENAFKIIELQSGDDKETSVIIGEDEMFEVFKMKYDSIMENENKSDLIKLHDFRSWFIFQILIKNKY